jgi:hypothetical protein
VGTPSSSPPPLHEPPFETIAILKSSIADTAPSTSLSPQLVDEMNVTGSPQKSTRTLMSAAVSGTPFVDMHRVFILDVDDDSWKYE